jgi:predicted ATPase/DNA-binding CsgD family transcriptional regulator
LVGREAVISEVRSLVLDDASRLVTIIGPGGVGKTRVAIEVARAVHSAFPHGVWFVSLAVVQDARFVMDAIANVLSVKPGEASETATALKTFLGNRRVLLVLDNMEHLPEATVAVDRMLVNCPGLAVLSTSRAPMRLSGERIYQLSPMTVQAKDNVMTLDALLASEAGRLFVERAQSVNGDNTFSDKDAGAIATICARLDGLPLAIELAASRTRILTPAGLLKRLDHRLQLLTGGPLDAPARQQALRDTIAWSYDLLPVRQQALFRRLAICVGGFMLAAADALSGNESRDHHVPGDNVFDDIGSLVDSSLIFSTPGPGDEPRFSMLETVREFGLEQLQIHGEARETAVRHAGFFQVLAQEIRPRIEGKDSLLTLRIFEAEHPNIRQALSWYLEQEDRDRAVRLTRDLWKFWWVHHHIMEGRSWMERTLALAGDEESDGVIEILYAAGNAALAQGDIQDAIACAQRALALAQKTEDGMWGPAIYVLLGNIAQAQGKTDRAREYLEHGISLSRLSGSPGSLGEHRTAMLLNMLAWVTSEQDDVERALELAEEAHGIWERRGDPWGIALSMSAIASLAAKTGDRRRAIVDKQECLRIFVELGDPKGSAEVLNDLAKLAFESGQPAAAIRLFGAVESIRQRIGPDVWLDANPDRISAESGARAMVGDRFAELAWNEGMALSFDQAVEEAMAIVPLAGKQRRGSGRSGVHHLTRRELDVLRLVATGATDQQIADTLFIASRTVTTHMTSILNKLNVENRTAAAALATRTGLV